nr:uncharacterized protein LOC123494377 [Aegilops tauschii subsp. strangulata]
MEEAMANTTTSAGGLGVALDDAKRRSSTSASAATQQLVHDCRDVLQPRLRCSATLCSRGGAAVKRSSPELQWSARCPPRSFNGALARRRRSCNGALDANGGAGMGCSSPAVELQWSARRSRMSFNGALARRRRSCNGALVARRGASMKHSCDGGEVAMDRSSPVGSCNGVLVAGDRAAMERSDEALARGVQMLHRIARQRLDAASPAALGSSVFAMKRCCHAASRRRYMTGGDDALWRCCREAPG